MKILHISDTHQYHRHLQLDLDGIDVIIHSGDSTNYMNPFYNFAELVNFIDWYAELPVQYKIYVPGNHDTSIHTSYKTCKELFEKDGIILLHKEQVIIDDKIFYGDATTPRYGNWAFMSNRNKMHKHWDMIPNNTDVLITHTPPKYILDVAENKDHNLEFCGCSNLYKQIQKRSIKLHCFGHIHAGPWNVGIMKHNHTTYSNGSCMLNGKFGNIINHGNIIQL